MEKMEFQHCLMDNNHMKRILKDKDKAGPWAVDWDQLDLVVA